MYVKKVISAISILLCLAMVFPMSLFANENLQETKLVTQQEVNEYLQNFMNKIKKNVEECTWNDDSIISKQILLYDLSYNVNGYVYAKK